MKLIDFVADRVSAYFYRRRWEKRQKRKSARAAWLFIVLCGCAPFHARRAIATIHDECEAAYRSASSEAEIEVIHERCDQRLEAIRHE